MFKIGDKIVYPMQGAGIIKSIEEKEICGIKQNYYIIDILINNMQIMVPLNKTTDIGIRSVVDCNTLEHVLLDFNNRPSEKDEQPTYRERYQNNMNKIKTGKLREGSEVVTDLMHLNNEKPLNSSEKQMLSTARKILISEVALIKDISENQASDLLNSCLSQ